MEERARLLRHRCGPAGQFLKRHDDLQGISTATWLQPLLDPSAFAPVQTVFDYSNMPVHGTSSYAELRCGRFFAFTR